MTQIFASRLRLRHHPRFRNASGDSVHVISPYDSVLKTYLQFGRFCASNNCRQVVETIFLDWACEALCNPQRKVCPQNALWAKKLHVWLPKLSSVSSAVNMSKFCFSCTSMAHRPSSNFWLSCEGSQTATVDEAKLLKHLYPGATLHSTIQPHQVWSVLFLLHVLLNDEPMTQDGKPSSRRRYILSWHSSSCAFETAWNGFIARHWFQVFVDCWTFVTPHLPGKDPGPSTSPNKFGSGFMMRLIWPTVNQTTTPPCKQFHSRNGQTQIT